jgi:phosphoribosylformylglycinamidine (FGAM) synthase PurS component
MIKIEWNKLKNKGIEDVVRVINGILEENPNLSMRQLTLQSGLSETTIVGFITKNGYELKDRQYVKLEQKESMFNIEKRNDANAYAELYKIVNTLLINTTKANYITTTLKIDREINDKINIFLEENQILKKQDVINIALLEFLKKYY